uniref:YchJ-like middle NTF2-like domain-containing protein n=1 Tax=Chlamydomonas chlamydogama TaxID=225041 RepID=A0A7S2QSU7_9CHLO|mmetsp:Transcript_127/g.236  ORF Transcript_127/g.236 Transcript_127/m.236 type:complete len:200 (+) Transcript_127:45-644(+)
MQASLRTGYLPGLRPSRPGLRDVRVCALKGFGKIDTQKSKCPCGSGKDYSGCCQRLHKQQLLKASGPEELLRARFAAYVKRDWKYLVRTTHSKNPARAGSTSQDGKIKTSFEQDVKVTCSWADFQTLDILQVRDGSEEAEVDLRFTMKQVFELQSGEKIKDAPLQSIEETARFAVEDGEWRFLGSQSNWDRNELKPVAA